MNFIKNFEVAFEKIVNKGLIELFTDPPNNKPNETIKISFNLSTTESIERIFEAICLRNIKCAQVFNFNLLSIIHSEDCGILLNGSISISYWYLDKILQNKHNFFTKHNISRNRRNIMLSGLGFHGRIHKRTNKLHLK